MTRVSVRARSRDLIAAPGLLWGIRLGLSGCVAVLVLCGCSRAPQDPSLLARVGQVRIEFSALDSVVAALPSAGRPDAGDLAAHRVLLQGLIHRELLLLEARAHHYGEDRWVQQRLAGRARRRLVQTMMQRQVLSLATVEEDEIQQAYAGSGWDQQVESLEIFVRDRTAADAARELLNQGVPIREVALTHSVDRAIGVPTGIAQRFVYSPSDGPADVVSALFALPEGGATLPIRLLNGFVIAQVVQRRTVPLEEVRETIVSELRELKGQALLAEYLLRLRTDLELTYHADGMALVVEALRAGSVDTLTAAQQTAPVYTFAGDTVAVAEVVARVAADVGRWPELDPALIRGKLRDEILPEKVMAADGRRLGVPQTREWEAWRHQERENLMLVRARTVMLAERLQLTDEDLQSFYEENKQRFRVPARAKVQELLVADPALARRLVERLEAGEDMAELAAAHSIRTGKKAGILQVWDSQRPLYGDPWMNAVMNAPLDSVRGPVKTEGGYSVFRVLERDPESYHALSNERVEKSVRRELTRMRERDLFNAHMDELERQHADEIEVFEGNLRSWTERGASRRELGWSGGRIQG
jgi:parvulin-like peptidyl-prolyl isomerase